MRLYTTHKLPIDLESEFEGTGIDVEIAERHPDYDEIEQKIENADALISLLRDKIDRHLIDKGKHLKIISNYAVGFDNIDFHYAAERKIYVTNTPDVLTETTADLVFALILAASRRICEADKYVRAGNFHGWMPDEMLGMDIHGKTMGIFGFGRIGQAVGRRARGFGMSVIYNARHTKKIDYEAQYVDFNTLIEKADIISINAPLTSETEALFDMRIFRKMKKTAVLVNTARGKIIRECDLAEALKKKIIYAAGLDVYENEPEINKAILGLDNCILAPHMGSASEETRKQMAFMCVESIKSVLLKNEEPKRCINYQVF